MPRWDYTYYIRGYKDQKAKASYFATLTDTEKKIIQNLKTRGIIVTQIEKKT